MAALDWVFATVLAVSVLLGFWRGLVQEVLSVLAWIAAFVLAPIAAPEAGRWLPMGETGEALRHAAGFVVVFVGVLFAGGLVAFVTRKLVEAVGLRPVDRTLGAAFGLVRAALLVLAVAVVAHLTPLRQAALWTESQGAAVATTALKGLKPVLPEEFGQYLPG